MRSLARHPLLVFFLLAFGLTWVVWVPRAVGVPVGIVGQLSTWIPAAAAVLAAALTGGRAAVRRLLAALVRWRVGWWWYALVILGPATLTGIGLRTAETIGDAITLALGVAPSATTGVAAG